MSLVALILLISSAFAQEGYPSTPISFFPKKPSEVVIKNSSCFPAVVFVNGTDVSLKAQEEVVLNASKWGEWNWFPGTVGSMNEMTLLSPIKGKSIPDFGPDSGVTHSNEFRFSYDFTVPEGSEVLAMESGIVVRVVQHYTIAHQDLTKIKEVNKVEVLHSDGSLATYAHLKPGSVKLNLCQNVSRGSFLGLSGHNGYSKGAHLHVNVMRPVGKGKIMTIPLKFLSE